MECRTLQSLDKVHKLMYRWVERDPRQPLAGEYWPLGMEEEDAQGPGPVPGSRQLALCFSGQRDAEISGLSVV